MAIKTGNGQCPFCNRKFVVGLNRETSEVIGPERCQHFRDTGTTIDGKVKVFFTKVEIVYVDVD